MALGVYNHELLHQILRVFFDVVHELGQPPGEVVDGVGRRGRGAGAGAGGGGVAQQQRRGVGQRVPPVRDDAREDLRRELRYPGKRTRFAFKKFVPPL